VVRVCSAETTALPVLTPAISNGPGRLKKKISNATPFEAGTIDVRAQVTVTLEEAR
jgi:hypothetical protein